MTVTNVAFATMKFLFDICDGMVDSDVGMGNFLLVLGILHVCGHTHMQSHASPGVDYNEKKCRIYPKSKHLTIGNESTDFF